MGVQQTTKPVPIKLWLAQLMLFFIDSEVANEKPLH